VYQRTPQGAMKHADRQASYRERLEEKVTHQGYLDVPAEPTDDGKQALIAAAETPTEVAAESEDQSEPELGFEESKPINQEPIPATASVSEAALAYLAPQREVYREYRCDFCGRRCGAYSRLGFIRRR
jgi:hypothetical protein